MGRPRLSIKKQTIWKLHSLCGLIAGFGLLLIGLSGSLLMFSKEIDGLLRPEVVRVSPPEGQPERRTLDELITRIAAAYPEASLMGWAPALPESGESDRFWVKFGEQEHWLVGHVDPFSGIVLGEPEGRAASFTTWLLELHYSFFADHLGMFLAGLLGVMLLLLGLSGLWLYRDFFRHFFRLRWGRSARLLFSDLHKFIGISTVVFHFLLGFTGAWWNLSHLLGHLFEEEVAEAVVRPSPSEWASVEAMRRAAAGEIAGFETRYLAFPKRPGEALTLYGQPGEAGVWRSPYGSMVFFDPVSGAVQGSSDVRDRSLWGQIYDSFVPLHYGTFGGWPIRLLWSLGGLAPGALAISGFVIWRSRSRRGKPVT